MSTPKTLTIKNWREFQHYPEGSRNIVWIKLYTKLLTDFEFSSMPELTQLHLIKIWLLCSESNGEIPNDPKWVALRIGSVKPVNLKILLDRGFLVENLASNLLADTLRSSYSGSLVTNNTYEEGEYSRKPASNPASRNSYPEDFEDFWKAYPKKTAKKSAYAEWKKHSPDITVCLKAIEAQKVGRKWREGYILDPDRWIKRGCWDDEVEPERNGPATINPNAVANGMAVDNYRLNRYFEDDTYRKLKADHPDDPWRWRAYELADFEKAWEGMEMPEAQRNMPRRPE